MASGLFEYIRGLKRRVDSEFVCGLGIVSGKGASVLAAKV